MVMRYGDKTYPSCVVGGLVIMALPDYLGVMAITGLLVLIQITIFKLALLFIFMI